MTQSKQDLIDRQLARLIPGEPDAVRAAAVRARCHAALAGHSRSRSGDARFGWDWIVELAGVGAFALVYLAFVVRDALASYAW